MRIWKPASILLAALLVAVVLNACRDADASVRGPELSIRAAPGDTLRLTMGWHLSRPADSTIITVSTSPNVGPPAPGNRIPVPGALTTHVLTFVPSPALVEGQSVTITACFASKRVGVTQAPCSPISASYTKPVDPGNATPDSLKVAGMYMDPPGNPTSPIKLVVQQIVTFCIYWTMGDSTVGLRTTDQNTTCTNRYVALYPANRRRISPAKQAIIDRECVEWTVTGGGTITLTNPCDRAVTPGSLGNRGFFQNYPERTPVFSSR